MICIRPNPERELSAKVRLLHNANIYHLDKVIRVARMECSIAACIRASVSRDRTLTILRETKKELPYAHRG